MMKWHSPFTKTGAEYFFSQRGYKTCRNNKSILVVIPVKPLEFHSSCIILLCKECITKLFVYVFTWSSLCPLSMCLFAFPVIWSLLASSKHIKFQIIELFKHLGNWGVCLLKDVCSVLKLPSRPWLNCRSSIRELSVPSELFHWYRH